MKKTTLKSINLENFKGRTMAFDFSDGRTVIRGTNEAGKSTLTNAFFWLLMGVDSQDRTNYELYDSTLDFTPENAIPAVVEGVFDIDGVEYAFKRVAKQKWVRPRGKSEYVKDPGGDGAEVLTISLGSATEILSGIKSVTEPEAGFAGDFGRIFFQLEGFLEPGDGLGGFPV